MIADIVASFFIVLRLATLGRQYYARRKLPGMEEEERQTEGRYLLWSLLAGALIANSIPHFIHGVSGENFPAPFTNSLGKGAATAVANVIWGSFNFAVGYSLLHESRKALAKNLVRVLPIVGFVACSLFLSIVFSRLQY